MPMHPMPQQTCIPRITLLCGELKHSDHGILSVTYGKNGVKVGCTFISYEALKAIKDGCSKRESWDY